MAPPAEVPAHVIRRSRFRDNNGNIISNKIWKTTEYRVTKTAWERVLQENPLREPYRGAWSLRLQQEMCSLGPVDGDTLNSILSWKTEDSQCSKCQLKLHDFPDRCGQQCYDWWRNCGPMSRLENDCELRPLPWNSGFPGHGVYLKETTPGGARMPSIARGQLVGEYVGELVPLDRDGAEYAGQQNGRYIFEGPFKRWLIDAGKWGNSSRFINHHCRPNLKAVPVVVGGRRLVTFRALRAVRAGDELTVNYGSAYFTRYNEKCRCNCKGTVVAHDPEPAP